MTHFRQSRPPLGRFARLAFILALLTSSACDEQARKYTPPDETWLDASEPMTLTPSTSPVAGVDPNVTFVSSVPYGTDPKQVFDAFLPPSDEPTPAIVYVHGGGFTAGSRLDVYNSNGAGVTTALAAGVAFFTFEYRLLATDGTESVGVTKSLYDSRRALQFIRLHAAELNIDPKRIGMYGGSAGAGTSAWLGLHDDMAEPGNPDRIARMSTRLSAIGGNSTQGTYDVIRWAPDVFGVEYPIVSNELLISDDHAIELLLTFYGLPQSYKTDRNALLARMFDPDYVAYRADLDMLLLASPDDPPLYLSTSGPDVGPLDMGFDLLHHPLHPKTLYEYATAAGVSVEVDVPAYQLASPYNGPVAFLLDHL